MTKQEFEILLRPEVAEAVRNNLERDPLSIALDARIPHASLVATQVKNLSKARKKLPEFYQAGCIIPSLAFEQSSSRSTAAERGYSGESCLDLTCGLGADAYYFSRSFNMVVTIEKDSVLAMIAVENFRRLGVHNITVVEGEAEDIIDELCRKGVQHLFPGITQLDLVYADPDRRSGGAGRKIKLDDCSPDITALLPGLRTLSEKILVKLSPMFDVAEIFRVFGRETVAEVISVRGECREITVQTEKQIASPRVKATVCDNGSLTVEMEHLNESTFTESRTDFSLKDFVWLVSADVSLFKSGIATMFFRRMGGFFVPSGGYALFRELPCSWEPFVSLPGSLYRIVSAEDYAPSRLRKELKIKGISRLNILRRGFRSSTRTIVEQLGIGEGGELFACLLTIDDKDRMLLLERVVS